MSFKELYVKCPKCENEFACGFEVEESPTQLIGFYYLCPNCKHIFLCHPSEYLLKVEGIYKEAMEKEEVFLKPRPTKGLVLIQGRPDFYVFPNGKKVKVPSGKWLYSNDAIITNNKLEKLSNGENEIINNKLFECVNELAEVFFKTFKGKDFSYYNGTQEDLIKLIAECNPDINARILEYRSDLNSDLLNQCSWNIEKCAKILVEENVIKKPPHPSTSTGYKEEIFLFLNRFMKNIRPHHFHPYHIKSIYSPIPSDISFEEFNESLKWEYKEYEKYLYEESVCDLIVCPLYNFTGPRDIKFENNSGIRKITPSEFQKIVEADEEIGYSMEYYPEFIIYTPNDGEDWRKVLNHIITALRLLKNEHIGLSRIYNAYALPSRPWKVCDIIREAENKLRNVSSSLTEPEETELMNLVTQIGKAESVPYLDIAMRRFNLAYERSQYEDKFVDYAISLESLYSEDSSQINYKISNRAANVLETGQYEDKLKTWKKMNDEYSLRSKIVHGVSKIDWNTNRQHLEEIELHVKKSLKWFITHDRYNDKKYITKMLDLGP